jgi:hypothetical protein
LIISKIHICGKQEYIDIFEDKDNTMDLFTDVSKCEDYILTFFLMNETLKGTDSFFYPYLQ